MALTVRLPPLPSCPIASLGGEKGGRRQLALLALLHCTTVLPQDTSLLVPTERPLARRHVP